MRYSYQTSNSYAYSLLKAFAKENKKSPTEAESILWEILRKEQLGVKFRRQYVVGDFIADFICLPHKLIIEVDGKYHNLPNQTESDNERSEKLNAMGFYVIRFTNEQILFETDYVIKRIQQHLKDTKHLINEQRTKHI